MRSVWFPQGRSACVQHAMDADGRHDAYDYGSDHGSDATDESESYSSYDSFSDGSPIPHQQQSAWMESAAGVPPELDLGGDGFDFLEDGNLRMLPEPDNCC